jgi:thiamine pyrophosphate-dependent acetolactate synthase large subunit-like protein
MADVAGAVVAALRAHGVTTMFGLLGEANLAIMLAAREAGIEWVAVRREDSAVAAADGYAQGTGRLGVAIVSQGPALANTINPLIGAGKGRTPLLLITGAIRPERRHEPQWLDQRAFIEGTGHVRYARVDEPGKAPVVLAEAIGTAVNERVPVVLEVPTWLQTEPAPSEVVPVPKPRTTVPQPDPMLLDKLAARLSAAKRPILIAGRGAAHAKEALKTLAARTGALLGVTLLQRGMFDGEPNSIGVVGGFATARSRELMLDADLIVVFGAGLNQFTVGGGALMAGRPVVRVDVVESVHVPDGYEHELVLGDSAVVAEALAARMPYGSRPAWATDADALDEFEDLSDENGLDLRTASRWLDEVLPSDRAIAVDLGYYTSEPCIHIGVRHPDRQAFTLHFGSIGLGLATAIGLSRAHPDLVTLAAVGDGGLMSSLQELETVARLKLPMVIAVYDDDAYAVEVYELQYRDQDIEPAIFPPVDFAAVARGLGIRALTLRNTQDLESARSVIQELEGPLLLDLRLRRGVITRWYRNLVHPDFPDLTPRMEKAS